MTELDPETREHLQALCRQITVAHELDPEIQEELYGHMEDKLLAYLSGEERLTEQDAFVLVREHFGDAAVIKGLLQDSHSSMAGTTLARRIAVAWSLTAIVQAVTYAILIAVALALNASHGDSEWLHPAPPYILFRSGSVLLSAIALWVLLARNRRAPRNGQDAWYLRWTTSRLIALAAASFLLTRLIPDPVGERPDSIGGPFTFSFIPAMAFLAASGGLVQCLAWIWWCDSPPRTSRSVAYALMAWVGYLTLQSAFPPAELYLSASGAAPGVRMTDAALPALSCVYLLHGEFANASYWHLRICVPEQLVQYGALGANAAAGFVIYLVTAVFARVAYLFVKRMRTTAALMRQTAPN